MYPDSKITNRYDDIIDLPHHQSDTRPRMSRINRAAQFAPFAALTGYEAAILETGRLTDTRTELDESRKAALSEKLRLLMLHLHDKPEVTITYFEPDQKKSGGAYLGATGYIRKVDEYSRTVLLEGGPSIPIDQIFAIDSPLFACLDPFLEDL